MQIDSEQFATLGSILELVFKALLELERSKNLDAFAALVNFELPAGTTLDFADSALESGVFHSGTATDLLLLLNHCSKTKKMLALRALPFLPDESSAELSKLQADNQQSWAALRKNYHDLLSVDVTAQERLDFIFVTFIEWLGDVDFFSVTPKQRINYLAEFPFFRS